MLEHRTPCLAFALSEPEHINVWKNRLEERGYATGRWLAELKTAIFERKPGDTPMRVLLATGAEQIRPLGELRETIISVTAGQKIAYVTDAAFSDANRRAIVDLARGADTLFIEAAFASGGWRSRRRPRPPDGRAGRRAGARRECQPRRTVSLLAALCRSAGPPARRGGRRLFADASKIGGPERETPPCMTGTSWSRCSRTAIATFSS